MSGISALDLVVGLFLLHDGRRIRIEEDVGDWFLRVVDVGTDCD